jgi:hypothetical protein
MPEAWGGGYIDNAYGDSPPPHVVWDLAKGSEGGDVCHVFGCAWQTRGSRKKTEQWMEVFMTFLLLAGCTVVTLDALRHVLGGCVFYEFGMFQE